jgi:glyoxylase I family protein
MLFTAIDHPAIACYDVQGQMDWYCTHLGMRVIARTETSAIIGYGQDARGGAVIEMMAYRDPGPRPADVPRFAAGLRHLAIRVSSFEKAYDQLKAAAVEFLMEPGTALGGGRIVSFRDPEGNELQIVER